MPIKLRKYKGLRIRYEEEKVQQAESCTLRNSPEACYLPAADPLGMDDWAALHPVFGAGGATRLPLPPGAPLKHPGICGQQNRGEMSNKDIEGPGE